jgi:tetratricopeptide (TPR) repeat protein
MPNKLSQFWLELKRRKVIKVVAMYSGAAFIIMEAADIMLPRLGLPDWTVTLIIVLLIVGFPIMIILSWIFDLTPDGIKKSEPAEPAGKAESQQIPTRRGLKPGDIIIALLFVAVSLLLIPKIFKADKFEDIRDAEGRISIAVMPFQNMTNDTLWNIWQTGIQSELITSLSNSEELSVRTFHTISTILDGRNQENYASISSSISGEISRNLNAQTNIQGSMKKSGDIIRLSAQLINSESGEIFKSFQIDGNTEFDILKYTDSLSNQVKNYLEIRVLEQDAYLPAQKHSETNSVEAYKYYIQGQKMLYSSEYNEAIKLYNNALEEDSSFVSALIWLTVSYWNVGQMDQARLIQKKAERYIDHAPLYEQLYHNFFRSFMEKDMQEAIKYGTRLTEEFPYAINTFYSLGATYFSIQQYEKSVVTFERLFELIKLLDFKWTYVNAYIGAGLCYHELGKFDEEQEVYKIGIRALPDHPDIIVSQAIYAFFLNDTVDASELISKYQSVCEIQGYSTSQIEDGIGNIYMEAGYLKDAHKHYQKAIQVIPEDNYSFQAMSDLASLLILNEQDINEGMSLLDQALEADHTDKQLLASIYQTKGLGHYKQGHLKEALEFLNKAWDLSLIYNHEHYLQIQKVEEALASQNQ